MNVDVNLEKKLMTYLRELSQAEQDFLRVFSAIYVNYYETIKTQKTESLENSIIDQIKFYGRKKEEYDTKINQLIEFYSKNIDLIIDEYNTRFCAIVNDLQDTWNNQKIAIANEKLSIEQESEMKRQASENKKNNYEIIIQECLKQLENCKNEMQNKLNEIFYDKDKALSVRKVNIIQKIINIFVGKSKIDNFVFKSLEIELNNLENTVHNEVLKINDKTIHNIAIIKDAQMQAQKIFNSMLEG